MVTRACISINNRCNLNCTYCHFHEKKDYIQVVIVDSVINTGRSIMRIIDEIKKHNPGIDVIIAANVIQNEAVELFKDYLVFATRLSKNSFVGVNQSKQTGKIGPDTADRLFNLIKVSKNSPSSTGGI
jgi:MoaA/NifB/PqqE/SkfB family radical SAM enzyme